MIMNKEPSKALLTALNGILSQGLNIYALINRLKKDIGQPKEWHFPEEVLLRVCKAYEQDKGKIDKPWPWFVKVIKAESAMYFAQQQINANDKRTKWAFSIKDLLKKGE